MDTLTATREMNGTTPEAARSMFTDFILIAEQVANEVYDSVSHDRLAGLRLVEIGELLNGPDAMLKVVWAAKWNDGHQDTFQFLLPLDHAVKNYEALPVRMQHRLQREVFRKDTILAL